MSSSRSPYVLQNRPASTDANSTPTHIKKPLSAPSSSSLSSLDTNSSAKSNTLHVVRSRGAVANRPTIGMSNRSGGTQQQHKLLSKLEKDRDDNDGDVEEEMGYEVTREEVTDSAEVEEGEEEDQEGPRRRTSKFKENLHVGIVTARMAGNNPSSDGDSSPGSTPAKASNKASNKAHRNTDSKGATNITKASTAPNSGGSPVPSVGSSVTRTALRAGNYSNGNSDGLFGFGASDDTASMHSAATTSLSSMTSASLARTEQLLRKQLPLVENGTRVVLTADDIGKITDKETLAFLRDNGELFVKYLTNKAASSSGDKTPAASPSGEGEEEKVQEQPIDKDTEQKASAATKAAPGPSTSDAIAQAVHDLTYQIDTFITAVDDDGTEYQIPMEADGTLKVPIDTDTPFDGLDGDDDIASMSGYQLFAAGDENGNDDDGDAFGGTNASQMFDQEELKMLRESEFAQSEQEQQQSAAHEGTGEGGAGHLEAGDQGTESARSTNDEEPPSSSFAAHIQSKRSNQPSSSIFATRFAGNNTNKRTPVSKSTGASPANAHDISNSAVEAAQAAEERRLQALLRKMAKEKQGKAPHYMAHTSSIKDKYRKKEEEGEGEEREEQQEEESGYDEDTGSVVLEGEETQQRRGGSLAVVAPSPPRETSDSGNRSAFTVSYCNKKGSTKHAPPRRNASKKNPDATPQAQLQVTPQYTLTRAEEDRLTFLLDNDSWESEPQFGKPQGSAQETTTQATTLDGDDAGSSTTPAAAPQQRSVSGVMGVSDMKDVGAYAVNKAYSLDTGTQHRMDTIDDRLEQYLRLRLSSASSSRMGSNSGNGRAQVIDDVRSDETSDALDAEGGAWVTNTDDDDDGSEDSALSSLRRRNGKGSKPNSNKKKQRGAVASSSSSPLAVAAGSIATDTEELFLQELSLRRQRGQQGTNKNGASDYVPEELESGTKAKQQQQPTTTGSCSPRSAAAQSTTSTAAATTPTKEKTYLTEADERNAEQDRKRKALGNDYLITVRQERLDKEKMEQIDARLMKIQASLDHMHQPPFCFNRMHDMQGDPESWVWPEEFQPATERDVQELLLQGRMEQRLLLQQNLIPTAAAATRDAAASDFDVEADAGLPPPPAARLHAATSGALVVVPAAEHGLSHRITDVLARIADINDKVDEEEQEEQEQEQEDEEEQEQEEEQGEEQQQRREQEDEEEDRKTPA